MGKGREVFMKSYCANNCCIFIQFKREKILGLLIAAICFSFNLSYMAFIDITKTVLCFAIGKLFRVRSVEKVYFYSISISKYLKQKLLLIVLGQNEKHAGAFVILIKKNMLI